MASISALHPQSRRGAYSPSKAGVLLLNKQLAAEWGPRGVRSNAACPGMIRTALSAQFYEVPSFKAARAAVTASRRVGEPSDIAEPCVFLLSDRATYVNGTELVVDGGLDCNFLSPASVGPIRPVPCRFCRLRARCPAPTMKSFETTQETTA